MHFSWQCKLTDVPLAWKEPLFVRPSICPAPLLAIGFSLILLFLRPINSLPRLKLPQRPRPASRRPLFCIPEPSKPNLLSFFLWSDLLPPVPATVTHFSQSPIHLPILSAKFHLLEWLWIDPCSWQDLGWHSNWNQALKFSRTLAHTQLCYWRHWKYLPLPAHPSSHSTMSSKLWAYVLFFGMTAYSRALPLPCVRKQENWRIPEPTPWRYHTLKVCSWVHQEKSKLPLAVLVNQKRDTCICEAGYFMRNTENRNLPQ